MRTITDIHTSIRTVEVVLSSTELAMRFGYTGLNVTHLFMKDGIVSAHMTNSPATGGNPFEDDEIGGPCESCIDENSHY